MLVKGSSLDGNLDTSQGPTTEQRPSSADQHQPAKQGNPLLQNSKQKMKREMSGSEGRLPTLHSDVTKVSNRRRGLLRRAETIECIVVRDDGQMMPADIDVC